MPLPLSDMVQVMPSIRIPPPHKGPLVLIATMGSARFDSLKSCLRHRDGDLSRQSVVKQIETATNITKADRLVDALAGAWAFANRAGHTYEQAAGIIAGSDVLKLSDNETSALAYRLSILFQSPVLSLLAHAISLAEEEEYSYCTLRILSDLRPMFSQDEDTEPVAALVRHTMKFSVHVEGRIESIVISVDDKALGDIRAGVERAMNKAQTLRQIAHKAGLRIVDLEATH